MRLHFFEELSIRHYMRRLEMFNYQNVDEGFPFHPQDTYNSSAVQTIVSKRQGREGFVGDKVFKLLDIKRRMCQH